jgi:hypothetical protein
MYGFEISIQNRTLKINMIITVRQHSEQLKINMITTFKLRRWGYVESIYRRNTLCI